MKGAFLCQIGYMSKLRHTSPKPLYFVLGFFFLGVIVYCIFRYLYPPQKSQIMAINPALLYYGQTTITGILQKDSPDGIKGKYVVILSDMRAVTLDIQGLDPLLTELVSVSGLLSPNPLSMKVSSISILNQ